MDIIRIFEDKLKSTEQSTDEFARKWDERAEMFYKGQVSGRQSLPNNVISLLKQKEIITDESTVLDIGAGSGRYTIPLAKHTKQVHALDFSKEMLRYLRKVSQDESITNISTSHLPWPTESQLDRVDVAFSAMCPCTRSTEALQQMSSVAKKYGVIAQMTKMSDSIIDELERNKLIEINPNDPHNNRDLAQSYVNILWELGFEPELNFVVDQSSVTKDLNQTISYYQERYAHVDKEKIRNIITRLGHHNQIDIVKTTRLAIISWSLSSL